jgi:hypothetical protein
MTHRYSLALVTVLGLCSPPPLSTAVLRPAGLSQAYDALPLGQVRVTKYTHVECRSRVTASGHVLSPRDSGRVCAVSRDWWRSRVKPGDVIWIPGYAEPCVALDTMALTNRKGLAQTHWIDIYITDRRAGLEFGIQHGMAYVIRARRPGAS